MSSSLRMQVIGRDGCYVMNGLRVRAAAGCRDRNGKPVPGSIWDEISRGVITPLAERKALADVRNGVSSEHKAYVRNLPIIQFRIDLRTETQNHENPEF